MFVNSPVGIYNIYERLFSVHNSICVNTYDWHVYVFDKKCLHQFVIIKPINSDVMFQNL